MKRDIALKENEGNWTMVIRPIRGLLDFRLDELLRARDLVMIFVWRDFVTSYKQTVLGPLWYVLQPIMGTLIFTVIFGQIAQLPTEGLPDFIFYMSGTVIWGYFSTCLSKNSDILASQAGLFGKVYFPRLAVPVSNLISNLISFSIKFVTFLFFFAYFWITGSAIQPNLWILLLPLLLLICAGIGLGIGLILSAISYRYRDLKRVVSTGISLWMYATPVVYPASSVPSYLLPLVQINPMTYIVQTFRYIFLGVGELEPLSLLYSFGFMVMALIIGLLSFNKAESTFLDTV
jgi:lipopolysaccharide transport system permease protein